MGPTIVMIGGPLQRASDGATVSFSRRTGGDVDSKTAACHGTGRLETAADSVVHEGGLQAGP